MPLPPACVPRRAEAEIARTQKNKATEGHIGLLKARLAKLRTQMLDGKKSGGGPGEGFAVSKTGDARVALIGFPSVGKSTLLSHLTDTKSQTAAYEFTTLTCIPGNVFYKGTRIQLLDLPGIIEGACARARVRDPDCRAQCAPPASPTATCPPFARLQGPPTGRAAAGRSSRWPRVPTLS